MDEAIQERLLSLITVDDDVEEVPNSPVDGEAEPEVGSMLRLIKSSRPTSATSR